tara:strand:- start:2440 stop:4155 length:1716 start_codon:yes stop_codon:yes gene_type:complete
MIIFKTVRWKNFLSTGNAFTEMQLDSGGATLITGDNGAGKSTFLDALVYGIYGKPFRKINKPTLINSINKKDLVVEVVFTSGPKEYIIRRGMKPTIFEIYIDGELEDQDAAARDYQDIIEKDIIKFSLKSFSQIIVLGSSSYIPFMRLPAGHRREVIEDLLDLQVFSVMNLLLKKKIDANKGTIEELTTALIVLEDKIALVKKHMSSLRADSEQRVNTNLSKIAENESAIADAKQKVNEYTALIIDLQAQITDLRKFDGRFDKLKSLDLQLKTNSKQLSSTVAFYEDNDNCPSCKQDIDKEFKVEIINEKRSKLEKVTEGLASIKQNLAAAQADIDKATRIQTQISQYQGNISESQWNMSSRADINEQLVAENAKLKDEEVTDGDSKADLEEFTGLYDDSNTLLTTAKERRIVIDTAHKILKDTGIKTRIIKQYIPVMNKLINKYLAAMDFFIQFELDENFDETIKSRYRDIFSYENFSEGEKMRIDLALLFTWRAIAKIRNSASTNLLIMDEVFDSSLDAAGVDDFLKVLSEVTGETNVFIMSHKNDRLIDQFKSAIRFEKHKSFSRMIT